MLKVNLERTFYNFNVIRIVPKRSRPKTGCLAININVNLGFGVGARE